MGWDEASLVWQGGPPGGGNLLEAAAALPVGCTSNGQPGVGDGCPKTVFAVPVNVKQLLYVKKTLVALTKDGGIGFLRDGNIKYFTASSSKEDEYPSDLPDLQIVENQSESENKDASKSNHDSELLERIGKVELIANCSGNKDAFFCVSAETKDLWKVELQLCPETKEHLEEVILVKNNEISGVSHVVSNNKHQFLLDDHGAVWSKGEVPYCGLIHSTLNYQKISYLSSYHVTQLQTGADFAACIASPKNIITPDTPTGDVGEDVPDDGNNMLQADPLNLTHESLSSQNSCPLGIKLNNSSSCNSSPVDKTYKQRSTSSLNCKNNSNEKKDMPRIDSSTSAILAEMNHDLDEPQKGDNSLDAEDSLLLAPHYLNKDDLYGRTSFVSLDDIRMSFNGKSASEPPPSNTEDCQNKLKRCSSLTLSLPPTNETSKNKPLSLNCKKTAVGSKGVAEKGEELWRDEVWTWGEGKRGQLGQGDMLARPNPVPVLGLHNQFIVKISVGFQHMLMLTGAGRVYGWGHNSSGQSNPGDTFAVVHTPTHIDLPRGEIARDIQAAGNLSLILCHSGNLFFVGQLESGQTKNRLQCVRVPELISSTDLHPCSILCLASVEEQGAKYTYLLNLEPVRTAEQQNKLVAAEKLLLNKVETVANLISQLQSGSPTPGQKKPDASSPLGRVWYWLIKCRNILAYSIQAFLNQQHTDTRWHGLMSEMNLWVSTCTELGHSIGTCICEDCLMLDSDQRQHQHNIVSVLLHQFGWKQQNIKGQIELEQLLLELFNLNLPYLQELESTLTSGHCNNITLVKQSIASIKSLQQTLKSQKTEAENTREFWESNTDTRIQSCRTASQRLLLDSKTAAVSLASAFSSHRFILFSDILIDIGYNKVSVHPLTTVWVDALPVSQGAITKPQISITTPEGTKILVCTGMDVKNLWLRKLNEAVYRALTGFKQNLIASPNIPITRAVTFLYSKGDLKCCEYNGAMTQGRMHGKGRLESPDGSVYTGSWRNDVKHGWGEFKLTTGIVRTGTWIEGHLTGSGCLKFPDGSEYEGDLVDGEPHGHGTMKCGRHVGDGATMYTGSWSHGTRHGYGVLENTSSGERYMGTWHEGLRHGKGCVVNSDGNYYEGNFVSDKLNGPGIIIFEDGSIYEGEFCGPGEFYGSGVLTTKTEKFQGTFYGSYSDGMKFNGTVYRRGCRDGSQSPNSDTDELNSAAVTQRYTVPSKLKWKAVFDKIQILLLGDNTQNANEKKCAWDNLSVQFHQNKIGFLEGRGEGKERKSCKTNWKGFDFLETIPNVAKMTDLTWANYCDIREYLVTANTCPIHPVHKVVSMLVKCFNASYGGLRAHPTLLPHAKDELEDMSSRLYAIIRNLFPCLPSLTTAGQMWLRVDRPAKNSPDLNGSHKNNASHSDSGLSSSGSGSNIGGWYGGVEDLNVMLTSDHLLFPLILPSIYPALFNLYIQKEDVHDREYWNRITRWNKHTDLALLTFFDVDTSSWELQLDRRSRDSVFLQAIYTLQRLKTTFTPAEKLDVIVDVFNAITNEKGGSGAGRGFTWNMDVLLPVCMYIIVRARVLQLGAELQLVSDFMQHHLRQGMQGITFITLQAAYTQIRRENVKMIRGLLATRSVLTQQVRGKALQNYARPSIDEIGVPTEPWKQVHDKNQTKFMMHLLVGIVSAGATITWFCNTINFNMEPTHLMKNEK